MSFAAAEAWGPRAIAPLLDAPFDPGMLVNINFPALAPADVKGIRVAAQGMRDYGRARMVRHVDPRGFPYYWLSFHGVVRSSGHSTDLEAIADGFVAVTPLHLDLTLRSALPTLAARY